MSAAAVCHHDRQHQAIWRHNSRGFARQDPVQAGNRRWAVAQQGNAPLGPPAVRPDDGHTKLCPDLHTLHDLWDECKFGIGGRKAASQFIGQEHGGHGVNEKMQRCCHGKRMFDLMERLVREGGTVDSAIAKIKVAHGQRASPIFIMNVVGNHGVHPALLQRDSQPAVNVFFAPRSVVRGGRTDAGVPRGGARGNHVPRPMDGSASVQGTLSAAISGLGAGNLMAVFQSTGVTANVQKASMQNWQLANCMQKQQFLFFCLLHFCICSAPLLRIFDDLNFARM